MLAGIAALVSHRPQYFFLAFLLIASGVVVLLQSISKPSAGQAPSQQAAVAANWYPDPNDPTLVRYFDGRNWTSQTAPRR